MNWTAWTGERIGRLKALWQAGASASMIAAELGVTRNAVIGKLHRCGLSARDAAYSAKQISAANGAFLNSKQIALADRRYAAGKAKKPAQERFAPVRPGEAVSFAPVAPTPIIEDVVIPLSGRVALVDLTMDHCRWPIGNPLADDFGFCGLQRAEPYSELNFYCAHHARIATVPTGAKREMTEEHKEKLRVARLRRYGQ